MGEMIKGNVMFPGTDRILYYYISIISNIYTDFTQVCRKRRLKGGFIAEINVAVLCRNCTYKFVQLY